MTEEEIVNTYSAKFGMLLPPLSYGHVSYPWDQLVQLAREALELDRPIPWEDMLAPLPEGADS